MARRGRPPKNAAPVPDPDTSRISRIVLDALDFCNSSQDHAEKVGYLGRCLEDLANELGIARR